MVLFERRGTAGTLPLLLAGIVTLPACSPRPDPPPPPVFRPSVVDTDTACTDCPDAFHTELRAPPESPLVGVMSWETSRPANSFVEIHRPGSSHLIVPGVAAATAHEVIAIGMHPDTTYELVAVSVFEDGTTVRSDPFEFTTAPLPFDWLQPDLDVLDAALRQPGWTIFNVASDLLTPVVAVIVDEEARPVWFYSYGSEPGSPGNQVSLTADNHVLIGPGVPKNQHIREVDLSGRVVWEGPERNDDCHHVFHKLSNGNYLTTCSTQNDDAWIADTLIELNADHERVWSWDFFDHVEIDPDLIELEKGQPKEYTHVNSVHADLEDDTVCAGPKYLDRVYKIDRSSGAIEWVLGKDGDFEWGGVDGEDGFRGAHGVTCLPDDHVLLFDNSTNHSNWRGVEYVLDFETMTAEVFWQFRPDCEVMECPSIGWGDIDRLANGNTLMTIGEGYLESFKSPVVEVTPEGEIVWQISYTTAGETRPWMGVFRADRIPALAHVLEP